MEADSFDLDFWETERHSARATIDALSGRAQAKIYALLAEMRQVRRGMLHTLKKTRQEQLWEYKARINEGGLRVLFAYGKHGRIWCLGAFVKRNEKEGNKLLKQVYEKLAISASQR